MSVGNKSEKQPLLSSGSVDAGSFGTSHDSDRPVRLKIHITMIDAVAIIVGNVIGSGVFVSPLGVTRSVGSVGASLIVWIVSGLFNMAQAMCYAELGCIIPKVGGDYAYIYEVVGKLPGFLCLWIHVLVIAGSGCGIIARTVGIYLLTPLAKECSYLLITAIGSWITVTFIIINCISTKWGARVQMVFSVAKLIAVSLIIITGVVKLCQGYTRSYENMFEGTILSPGGIALAVLSGYFASFGWELVNTLPEEMVNPQRDLPRAVWIAMTMVTVINTMLNVAFFSVLTPDELIASNAVAMTFAKKTLGVMAFIVPIFVALCCMGTVNGSFMAHSRYLYAGGRFGQVPSLFAMINYRFFTPLPAVITIGLLSLLYSFLPDLDTVQQFSSLGMQFKISLSLAALVYLRIKKPNIYRPVKVNFLVLAFVILLMAALIVLSVYEDPVTMGLGAVIFFAGIPVYYLCRWLNNQKLYNAFMDKLTIFIQRFMLVVPES